MEYLTYWHAIYRQSIYFLESSRRDGVRTGPLAIDVDSFRRHLRKAEPRVGGFSGKVWEPVSR